MKLSPPLLFVLFAAGPLTVLAGEPRQEPAAVQVFILAGQSNMEGQGVVDLDHPQHYNGGRGTLQQVLRDPAKAEVFAGVQDTEGRWVVRDDVWCRYRTPHELKRGPLSIGFAVYPGKHHIGPAWPSRRGRFGLGRSFSSAVFSVMRPKPRCC